MSAVVSSDLARAVFANDARAVARALLASDPPCTHVAPGVPAIAYAVFLQRPAALDALLCECPGRIDVNACHEHPPFVGWRAAHFARADRDSEATKKLVAAGADASDAPNELVGTAWLDAVEGLSDNNFTGYVAALKAAEDSTAFIHWHDPAGRTALHIAAILGSGQLVRLLFELGLENASPADFVGHTPLSLAIQHAQPSVNCIRALLDNGTKPTADHVLSAASRGLARVVALLVGAGAPVPPGVSRRAVKNAVGVAANMRSWSTTESMLRSAVLMNEAIARGDLEAFEILLATAAHDASQLLARVAACGSLRMLEVLLTAPGVDPNARVRAPGCAFEGGTALHFAVASFEPRDDHVRALVTAGADANAELPCGLRAMDVANLARTRSLLASLGGQRAPHKATAARSTFRTTLRLLVALQRNDFAEMRLAIAAGADPNTADMLGNTSLHQAVLQQSASDIIWLLKSGADLNAKSWNGDGPLHLAVITRHLPTVELMLAAGADAGVENAYGCCPARLAARVEDVAAWRAITTHVAARNAGVERHPTPVSSEPQTPRRGRVPRTKQPPPAASPVSEEERQKREAAAEAAAAELLAGEVAEKAARARIEMRRTKRRLKKQRARLQKLEAEDSESVDDNDGDGGHKRASSADEDEPEWLSDLLEPFDAGSGPAARRNFVEHSVRLCASLKLQLETVLRCVVCMDGARGTILKPCGHAQLCRGCAARVTDGETEAERRCPVCLQGVTGWAPAFL